MAERTQQQKKFQLIAINNTKFSWNRLVSERISKDKPVCGGNALWFHRHLLAATALAALVLFASVASAQDSGSMQVGGATVSVGVGAGAASLSLPNVRFG